MSLDIVLVDDHRILRDGIRLMVDKEPDMRVVGEADDGRKGLELIRRLCPHIAVMDIGMPDLNGIEATRAVRTGRLACRIIVLSMYCDRLRVLDALEAGASGYIPKSNGCQELVLAIRAVAAGQCYVSPAVAEYVIDWTAGGNGRTPQTDRPRLRPREREVLQLVAEGKSSKEIAASLNVSPRTVDAHRREIMAKLHAHTIAELTKCALRLGLTTLEE